MDYPFLIAQLNHPTPLVLTENVGFNSSCSCAQDSPHKSLPFLYVTSKLQTEKCPGTPEAEQIFSTTTLHVPRQPAVEVPKDSQDSQVKFLQDWMMADCSVVHNLLQLLWRDTDSHQWKKLSRCSRYRCSASHIPWCFRILCSCHQQPCHSISFHPHACNEHGKNEALGQGMQEHDYHPCVSNQIASLKGSQWLPKVAPLLLLLLTLSYMPPDENW